MPDMYDKLGDMLNDVLESGKIPADSHSKAEGRSNPSENQNDQVNSDEKNEKSGHFSFKESKKSTENNKKSAKKDSKSAFATGEVIKLHKYTYNIQFPSNIQLALTTLDIAYPFTARDIKKQYRKLLKENHPDTKKTIQTSQDIENNRQKTVDEITEAYKILCSFFGIK